MRSVTVKVTTTSVTFNNNSDQLQTRLRLAHVLSLTFASEPFTGNETTIPTRKTNSTTMTNAHDAKGTHASHVSPRIHTRIYTHYAQRIEIPILINNVNFKDINARITADIKIFFYLFNTTSYDLNAKHQSTVGTATPRAAKWRRAPLERHSMTLWRYNVDVTVQG